MSQRWATHRSPTYEPTESGYSRKIVYCNTEYFAYPTAERSYGGCKLHKGLTSYDRCTSCKDNDGTAEIKYAVIPPPVKEVCVYRDTRYDARRQGCKRCGEKTECLNQAISSKFKLRVIQ